jgi:hypothetical protein
MLMDATDKITGDTEIKRSMPAAGKKIDVKRQFLLRWSFRDGPWGRARNL